MASRGKSQRAGKVANRVQLCQQIRPGKVTGRRLSTCLRWLIQCRFTARPWRMSSGQLRLARRLGQNRRCNDAPRRIKSSPDMGRGIAVIVRLLLLAVGLIHIVTGVAMLVAPGVWYVMVPGVVMTGPFNAHFIYDIGMAFLASGAMLALARARTGTRPSMPAPVRCGRCCTRSSTSKVGCRTASPPRPMSRSRKPWASWRWPGSARFSPGSGCAKRDDRVRDGSHRFAHASRRRRKDHHIMRKRRLHLRSAAPAPYCASICHTIAAPR